MLSLFNRKNYNSHRSVLIIFAIAIFLSSCSSGPSYQTTKSYVKPKSNYASVLVGQCKQMRQQCKYQASNNKQSCLKEVSRDKKQCVNLCINKRAQADVNRGVHGTAGMHSNYCKTVECSRYDSQCSNFGSDCNSEYDKCYVNAGGQITYDRVCIKNCGQNQGSLNGKYSNLIQKIHCPSDQEYHGQSKKDFGYFPGSKICGEKPQQSKTGYLVWVNPSWYIWGKKNK